MTALRRYLLATASTLALAGGATAADLPVKAPTAPVVVWNWTGPYIGINAGWAQHRARFTEIGDELNANNFYAFLPGTTFWRPSASSFTAGGQIGYNIQSGNIVFGAEADLNWINGRASALISPPPTIVAATKLDWMATLRGRLGIALSPTLVYVTGGLAIAHIADNWGFQGAGAFNPNNFRSSGTRAGWVAGGGIEHRVTGNWTVKVEALFADFGNTTVLIDNTANGNYRSRFVHQVTTVRGGLNWKW